MSTGHRSHDGVTLIELLITLAVMAVLMSIAAPALHRLAARTSVSTAQNALIAGLHMARTQAVQSQVRTVMCPSRDGRHCQPGIRWDHGWVIAYDRNHDGMPDGMPIHVHQALAENSMAVGSRGRQRIYYHSNGSAPGSNLTLTLCASSRDTEGSGIVVANSGRIRRTKPDEAHLAHCRTLARTIHESHAPS